MTTTSSISRITIFLLTGELEIARIIRDNCRRKPRWTVLASAAVRVVFVAGSVTCSAPLPIGLYTVVRGIVASAACNSYMLHVSHDDVRLAELCAARIPHGEFPQDRPCHTQTPPLPGLKARESIGLEYES